MSATPTRTARRRWIVNTSLGRRTTEDSFCLRRAALDFRIPYTTTKSGALFMVKALEDMRTTPMSVQALQDFLP